MSSDVIVKEIQGTRFTILDQDYVERTFDIEKIFSIDDTDITGEYMRQPSLYAYFGVLMAASEKHYNMAKTEVQKQYAMADGEFRKDAALNGQKLTETQIKSMIETDELYNQALAEQIEAEYAFKLLKIIAQAMEQRADMLVSLGSHLRHELSMTGMSIRDDSLNDSIKKAKEVMKNRPQRAD